MDDVVERVTAIVSGIAGSHRTPPKVDPTTPLVDGGFWLNSVDLLEVIIACEAEFNVALDAAVDLTTRDLGTIGSLADLMRAKR